MKFLFSTITATYIFSILACVALQAAPPDADLAPISPTQDAKALAFFVDLFSDTDFTDKMKPIVDKLKILEVARVTREGYRKMQAEMAKQWKEQAGPIFNKKMKAAGLARGDIVGFLLKLRKTPDNKAESAAAFIHRNLGAKTQKQTSVDFISHTLLYIERSVTEDVDI